jgi:hypothetical protein
MSSEQFLGATTPGTGIWQSSHTSSFISISSQHLRQYTLCPHFEKRASAAGFAQTLQCATVASAAKSADPFSIKSSIPLSAMIELRQQTYREVSIFNARFAISEGVVRSCDSDGLRPAAAITKSSKTPDPAWWTQSECRDTSSTDVFTIFAKPPVKMLIPIGVCEICDSAIFARALS